MINARIEHIETHFPDHVLSNADLCVTFPSWTPEKILAKTGISERRISAPNETSVDLGVKAAQKLLMKYPELMDEIDYLIFCSQTADHFLPTSACIIQDRLGLPKHIGAFDINQGCSGYVYSLAVAKGMIVGGIARKILLITADTYTKLINENDTSVRTLFGDGAAASVITASEGPQGIKDFVFGTNGAGANQLIVPAGGFRQRPTKDSAHEVRDEFGNTRSADQLFMDGSKIMMFGLGEVPKAIKALLTKAELDLEQIDHFIFHQASLLMLEKLIKKLKIDPNKAPLSLEYTGNTVSSTIPILLKSCIDDHRFETGDKLLLAGFGVGLSWAACIVEI
ncbi:3-oxoacyl-ACP synthase [Amylibacter marinus]|uniref:3-oxoacyl-ACP synthase n=1 Tax=Amylibacter marinus TaxID=1475483 RepID=A0ABQ5VX89_9RHOB|nr:ketoacyl-ACP synthase III [Amylibacter marinus]GLQ35970.1 3-oxoacyl-ACP synthase [Amylibacter marinus]